MPTDDGARAQTVVTPGPWPHQLAPPRPSAKGHTYRWYLQFFMPGEGKPRAAIADGVSRQDMLNYIHETERSGAAKFRIARPVSQGAETISSVDRAQAPVAHPAALTAPAQTAAPAAKPADPDIPWDWVYCPRCARPTEPFSGSYTYTATETVRTHEVGTNREFLTELPVQRQEYFKKCRQCKSSYRFAWAHTKAEYEKEAAAATTAFTIKLLLILAVFALFMWMGLRSTTTAPPQAEALPPANSSPPLRAPTMPKHEVRPVRPRGSPRKEAADMSATELDQWLHRDKQ